MDIDCNLEWFYKQILQNEEFLRRAKLPGDYKRPVI